LLETYTYTFWLRRLENTYWAIWLLVSQKRHRRRIYQNVHYTNTHLLSSFRLWGGSTTNGAGKYLQFYWYEDVDQLGSTRIRKYMYSYSFDSNSPQAFLSRIITFTRFQRALIIHYNCGKLVVCNPRMIGNLQ